MSLSELPRRSAGISVAAVDGDRGFRGAAVTDEGHPEDAFSTRADAPELQCRGQRRAGLGLRQYLPAGCQDDGLDPHVQSVTVSGIGQAYRTHRGVPSEQPELGRLGAAPRHNPRRTAWIRPSGGGEGSTQTPEARWAHELEG